MRERLSSSAMVASMSELVRPGSDRHQKARSRGGCCVRRQVVLARDRQEWVPARAIGGAMNEGAKGAVLDEPRGRTGQRRRREPVAGLPGPLQQWAVKLASLLDYFDTDADAAAKLNYSATTISRFLNGERVLPREQLGRLYDALAECGHVCTAEEKAQIEALHMGALRVKDRRAYEKYKLTEERDAIVRYADALQAKLADMGSKVADLWQQMKDASTSASDEARMSAVKQLDQHQAEIGKVRADRAAALAEVDKISDRIQELVTAGITERTALMRRAQTLEEQRRREKRWADFLVACDRVSRAEASACV